MTDPFNSDGAKAPANKPFTVEAGHRKVRSFVPRRAAGKTVFRELRTRRHALVKSACGL